MAILVRLVLLLLLLDFGLLDLGGILRLDLGLSLSLRLILFGGGRFLARLSGLLIGLIRREADVDQRALIVDLADGIDDLRGRDRLIVEDQGRRLPGEGRQGHAGNDDPATIGEHQNEIDIGDLGRERRIGNSQKRLSIGAHLHDLQGTQGGDIAQHRRFTVTRHRRLRRRVGLIRFACALLRCLVRLNHF
ncbi:MULTISPECIES: hypothetical protein [unclassified Sphingomonas]|uniref:hypothetical protein n=1 Tax=unclassified Sphingomonas TaxID=196159 RepID=UPI00286BD225|nr:MULTISPECIES: hypothetical protein [unclassified Sphingomonas]